MSADIFAGQPSDPDLLARIYDLEHDEIVEDFAFYREQARRAHGHILDLGCGSGRLFPSLLPRAQDRLTGVDGSPALLRRAADRIAADPRLAEAAAGGRLTVVSGDVRRLDTSLERGQRFALIVAVGVLPHLDGPEDALRMLAGARGRLEPGGHLILDDIGPRQMPDRDLALSVDWKRDMDGQPVVRRSQLQVRQAPEGLRVFYSTIVDVGRPDGTIARLPASHRLWYSSTGALTTLVRDAGLDVELSYGSHDLDPLDATSDRRILVIRAF